MRSVLKQARQELGFKSARAFFLDIQNKTELNFNYSYYSKIENGDVLPSSQVIQTLCGLLPDEWADRLVLAYCATLFPDRSKLFHSEKTTPEMLAPHGGTLLAKQRTLTERQVATLTKTEHHYFAFLVFTLARTPISSEKLEEFFTTAILKDLKEVKLITETATGWISTSREMRFPKADNDTLKATYKRLDQWDINFAQKFEFERIDRKIQIRRISPRYIGLILGLSKTLQELLRAADEVHPSLNDEVISFRLELYQGKLPG